MGSATDREISCRITKTLLLYVRENNNGSLGSLLEGLDLDEQYLLDPDNWVSHDFLQTLYDRMIDILHDKNAVYHMALASDRVKSLGMLDRIARLLGSPHLIYSQASIYNKLLKLNGDVYIHDIGDAWVLLEDRYHASHQKTRYDCDYTRGILTGIPIIFDMPMAEVEEIECQVAAEHYGKRTWKDSPSYGARGCLYKVQWNQKSKPSFWKQILKYGIYVKALRDLREANKKIQDKYNEVRELASDLQRINQELEQARNQQDAYLRKLEASEARYRLLAENISDIIWTLSLETMLFTYVSPSVEKLRGYTPQEAMALSVEETLSPDSLKNVTEALTEALAMEGTEGVDPNRSRTMAVQQSCKDGSYTWGEVTVTFLRDQEGRPVSILGVTRDINKRLLAEAKLKQNEEERRSLQERLLRAEKMESLGTLAGGVAHDLNNILGILVGFSEILLMGLPEGNPLRRHALNIFEGGERASAIIQDLLTLARRGVTVSEIVNMNKIISDIQKMPEYEVLKSYHPNVMFKIDLEPELLNIKGSPVHLHKTVMNLLINAAEAINETGNVIVRTENRYVDRPIPGYEWTKEGEYVALTVSDSGIGISTVDLERVFEPFYTKKIMGRSGTGLGLAVVWGTVKDHEGYIDVQSEINRGSIFTLYFPASREAVMLEKEAVSREDYLGRGERILVIDDVEGQRLLAVSMLSSLGYQVDAVASGEEAVEYVKTHPVDLIVLDMIMDPGIDGLETYQRIKDIRPDQKAVIVSGFAQTERVKQTQEMGAGEYVRKPYLIEKIGLAVRREIDRV